MKDKTTETPSAPDTESEERKPDTESEGKAPEAGISQDEVNRIVAREKAKLERKLRAEYEAKQTKPTPVKDESPPPQMNSDEIAALRKEMADMKADAAFDKAIAGLDVSDDDRATLREAYGTKAFDLALKSFKPAPVAPPPPRATPGATPQGPPQADREVGLTGATKDDVARWKESGELLKRAEAHRNAMGGSWVFFNKGLRKRDK